MATRTYLPAPSIINALSILTGVAALVFAVAILLTGIDLRSASTNEAFVARGLPWLFLAIGLLLISKPFWAHKVR